MNTKILKIVITSLFFTIIMTACNEDNLLEKPPHLITAETLYTSLDGFEAGLNGLYSEVRYEVGGRGGAQVQRLMGGPFLYGTDAFVTMYYTSGMALIAENWGESNNGYNIGYVMNWRWLYGVINSANTIISRAEQDDIDWTGGTLSPADEKNRILAEARAIRAWCYRHLTFGWGDVPLTLEESSGQTIRTDWVRTPVAEVREVMLEDFLFAEEHVGIEPSMQGRISKGAIQHYIAEMYLVKNDPQSALEWANKVVNNPAYKLVKERYGVDINEPGNAWTDMFQDGNQNREDGNTEALWVFPFAYQVSGGWGSMRRRPHSARYQQWVIDGVAPLKITFERGGRGSARNAMTKWLLDSYEQQDYRNSQQAIRRYFILRTAEENTGADADNLPPGMAYGDTLWLDWSKPIVPDDHNRPNWPFSRKFEGVVPTNVSETANYNDQIYLRAADTYLLKAEAEYKLNRPGDAAETINIIRRRANASEITASDVDMDYILDERARELFYEEQRRWTLNRTGKWLERTRLHNHNGGQLITERDTLHPIPQEVIDANITQEMPNNPGY